MTGSWEVRNRHQNNKNRLSKRAGEKSVWPKEHKKGEKENL